MKKSSAYLTTVKKMDQNICSGTKNDHHKKKEVNTSIGWQTGHAMILIHQYIFQGPSIPFLRSVITQFSSQDDINIIETRKWVLV
jgi:hypothetical protein